MDVGGLTVLVTAAAGGAGRVIAERFAEAGALVHVCDVDAIALEEIRSAGPRRVTASHTDLSDPAAIDRLLREVHDRFGALDVLVNNAGISGPTKATEDLSIDEWNSTMDVNVRSHFLCARGVIPGMKARGAGTIINISSSSARVGLPLRLPYVVSKAAVLSLTQTMARELGPHGIRVNAILPGAIEGDRLRRVISAKALALGVPEADYERDLLRYISLRSTVTPSDIAALCMFLASPMGARITGQSIGVDGNVEWEG